MRRMFPFLAGGLAMVAGLVMCLAILGTRLFEQPGLPTQPAALPTLTPGLPTLAPTNTLVSVGNGVGNVGNPTETVLAMLAIVDSHALRVRECPATHCKTIDYLEYGDAITTTGLCSGAWLQIRPRGWVNSHYVNNDHCKK